MLMNAGLHIGRGVVQGLSKMVTCFIGFNV